MTPSANTSPSSSPSVTSGDTRRDPAAAVRVSFIIPAHNEERLIGATVTALHEAAKAAGLRECSKETHAGAWGGGDSTLTYEIVVAADACSDATATIARQHGALVVECQNKQISKTRNSGALASRGRWLVFVDADTVVPAAAVRDVLSAFKDGVVGGGAAVIFDGQIPFWGRVLLPPVMGFFRWVKWTGGAFLFCTREALDRVGGWDETLYASEEIALCKALKALRGSQAFVIIPSRVVTSGRKLRVYSGWEILRMMLRILSQGRGGLTKREGLDLWYQRREEQAS